MMNLWMKLKSINSLILIRNNSIRGVITFGITLNPSGTVSTLSPWFIPNNYYLGISLKIKGKFLGPIIWSFGFSLFLMGLVGNKPLFFQKIGWRQSNLV